MNKTVSEFLEGVCSFVRCESVHEEIREELMDHIDEKADVLMNGGADEESAYKEAVSSMGNPLKIGEELDKRHRPQTEWSLILLTAAIAFFGIVIVYLSKNSDIYLIDNGRYAFYALIGIAGATVACFYNYVRLKDFPFCLYASAIVILVLCSILGIPIGGIKRYIRIGYLTLSVNHISTILFIAAFAGYIAKYKDEGMMGILKLGCLGFSSAAIFLIQPSLSSAMITGIACFIMIIVAVSRNHFGGRKGMQAFIIISSVLVAGIVCFLLLFAGNPVRLQRIMYVFDKGASDPYGGGWVYSIADKVLDSAKFIGRAEPLSVESVDRLLPGITSDFALINIIYNFGWLAGIVLILIVGIYLIRIFKVTSKIKNSYGFYLSLGSALLLAIQFVVNILYNLGFFPIVDVTMPFVSYGGSGYLASMICVGILLSVWRRNNILPASKEKEKSIRIRKKYITFEGSRLIIDFDPDEEYRGGER